VGPPCPQMTLLQVVVAVAVVAVGVVVFPMQLACSLGCLTWTATQSLAQQGHPQQQQSRLLQWAFQDMPIAQQLLTRLLIATMTALVLEQAPSSTTWAAVRTYPAHTAARQRHTRALQHRRVSCSNVGRAAAAPRCRMLLQLRSSRCHQFCLGTMTDIGSVHQAQQAASPLASTATPLRTRLMEAAGANVLLFHLEASQQQQQQPTVYGGECGCSEAAPPANRSRTNQQPASPGLYPEDDDVAPGVPSIISRGKSAAGTWHRSTGDWDSRPEQTPMLHGDVTDGSVFSVAQLLLQQQIQARLRRQQQRQRGMGMGAGSHGSSRGGGFRAGPVPAGSLLQGGTLKGPSKVGWKATQTQLQHMQLWQLEQQQQQLMPGPTAVYQAPNGVGGLDDNTKQFSKTNAAVTSSFAAMRYQQQRQKGVTGEQQHPSEQQQSQCKKQQPQALGAMSAQQQQLQRTQQAGDPSTVFDESQRLMKCAAATVAAAAAYTDATARLPTLSATGRSALPEQQQQLQQQLEPCSLKWLQTKTQTQQSSQQSQMQQQKYQLQTCQQMAQPVLCMRAPRLLLMHKQLRRHWQPPRQQRQHQQRQLQ